jgi:hypothetical protein
MPTSNIVSQSKAFQPIDLHRLSRENGGGQGRKRVGGSAWGGSAFGEAYRLIGVQRSAVWFFPAFCNSRTPELLNSCNS